MQRTVIFDMDGVLVDTYHAHYKSWVAMAEPEGFTFTEEQFAPTFGRTSREIIGLVSTGRAPEELDAADLVVRQLSELNPERVRDLF
jgi:beta-phosphoglucomutase